jgi:hypothetical protein
MRSRCGRGGGGGEGAGLGVAVEEEKGHQQMEMGKEERMDALRSLTSDKDKQSAVLVYSLRPIKRVILASQKINSF